MARRILIGSGLRTLVKNKLVFPCGQMANLDSNTQREAGRTFAMFGVLFCQPRKIVGVAQGAMTIARRS